MSDRDTKTFNVPHGRLRLAVVLLSLIAIAEVVGSSKYQGVFIYRLVAFPLEVWIAYFAVYRVPELHKAWGIMSSLGALLGLVVYVLFGVIALPKSMQDVRLIAIWLGIPPMPILAYLMLFDPQVAAYRRQLPKLKRSRPLD
jgi:hypothetical protein